MKSNQVEHPASETKESNMTRHMGGSILPSAGPTTYKRKEGSHGAFETRPLDELDTHGLYFIPKPGVLPVEEALIASHPNGFSCDNLAQRMIDGWSSGDAERAMDQFDYILACGGEGLDRDTLDKIAKGLIEDIDFTGEVSRPAL
jgi:hypothetical protein